MRVRIARLLRRCAYRLDHREVSVVWAGAGNSYNTSMRAARNGPPINWRDP